MTLLTIILLIIGFSTATGLTVYYFMKPARPEKPTGKEPGKVDHSFSEGNLSNPDFEIPEQDQEYLAPILSNAIGEYVPLKLMYPSNAMLIDHLGVALGEAAHSFEKRRVASDDHQEGNKTWLKVAAWAMRLYKEGTPHNSTDTLERFQMIENLSKRNLRNYATATMNQAGAKIQKIMDRDETEEENPGVKRMKSVSTGNKLNPYTDDEIEDMKRAEDQRRKDDQS